MNRALRHSFLVLTFFYIQKGVTQDYIGELPDFNPEQIEDNQNNWLLKLNVNGHLSDKTYSFQRKGNDFWGDADLLRAHSIHVASELKGYVNMGQLTNVTTRYNNASQSLEVTVPAEWLPEQQYEASNSMLTKPHRDTGLLINYDLYGYRPAREAGYGSAYVSSSLFTDKLYLVNAGTWFQGFNGASGYYSRLNTTLTIDDEAHLNTFQVGDIFTRPVVDENSVRLGGIKFSRDYSLNRNFITYPTMQVKGTASVPNKIDIFVNNSRVADASVNSGPFVVSNIPFINGDGTAQVVTTDANGRQVTSTIAFYNSSQLLKAGLSDFDFNIGLLRYSRNRDSNRYQYPASSLSYRYGLTDYLTTAVHAEAAGQLEVVGMAHDVKLGTFGVVSGSLYHSHTNQEAGNRYSIGYSYNNQLGAFSVNHQQNDSRYHSLADYKSEFQQANSSDQINLSGYLGPVSLGAGFFRIKSDRDVSRVVNLSASLGDFTTGTFTLSLSRELGGANTSAYLSWSKFFGDDLSLGSSVSRSRLQNSQSISLSKGISGETGLGGSMILQHQYSKAYTYNDGGGDNTFNGSLDWKHRYGELQGGVWHPQPHQEDYWLETSGSLIVMDNSLFATREVSDAFLLIDTNGVSNVSYSVEGRTQDKTNQRGIAFVPDIASYTDNRVVISPEEIPADVDIAQLEQISNVKRGGGRIVRFALSQSNNVTLRVRDPSGNPLSAGLLVRGLPGGETTMTGYDGIVYLSRLDKPRILEINGADHTCHITVDPANINRITRQMAPLTCK